MSSVNSTVVENLSSYDSNGAIIYIFGVLIWYAIGFGLILIDDINPQPGRVASHRNVSVYQTVNDLYEQQDRNDILVELKDKERRMKLWQIYYGSPKTHPFTIEKDNAAVELIVKQLNELNERRRSLRHTLNQLSFEHNSDHSNDDSDDDKIPRCPSIQSSRSNEQFRAYFQ